MRRISNRVPAILLFALVAATLVPDVFRIGFCSDDFIFLDAARREPVGEVLLGQHGVWPWYRPLSRELYFLIIVAAGPLGLAFARLASIAAVFATAGALWSLGRTFGWGRAAAVAPVLFVGSLTTKFLAAWASGFQDLLAVTLTTCALASLARGSTRRAIALAALAPLAKESGFVAPFLLVLYAWIVDGVRRPAAWVRSLALATAAVAAVHAAVRLTWSAGNRGSVAPPIETGDLLDRLGRFAVDLVPWGLPTSFSVALVAVLAAVLAALLVVRAGVGVGEGTPAPSRRNTGIFIACAVLVGIAPVVVGHWTGITHAHPYHFVPALPWIVLLVGWGCARCAVVGLAPAAAAFAFLALCGGAARPVDLDRVAAWADASHGWVGVQHVERRTARMGADLRLLLAERPESSIVLYATLPSGAMFQTEDGPATREFLDDGSVRAYFLTDAPSELPPGRVAILSYDSERTFHLQRARADRDSLRTEAITALMAGEPKTARAVLVLADESGEAPLADRYLRAQALLLEDGPRAFLASLAQTVGESTGTAPEAAAAHLVGDDDPALTRMLARALRSPTSAALRVELAESLLVRRLEPAGVVELRLAQRLDPRSPEASLRLASLFRSRGNEAAAARELERARDANAAR